MFNWEKIYDLAVALKDREEEEYKRTVISRAYYSAYGRTRQYLESRGLVLTNYQNAHRVIWDNCYRVRLNEVSVIGDRLKRKRQKADYESEISAIDRLVKDSIAEAQKIHQFLNEKEK